MAVIIKIPSDANRQPSLLAALYAYLVSSHPNFVDGRSISNTYAELLPASGEWKRTPIDNTIDRFIKLEQSFMRQYEVHPEYFGDQSEYCVREKMKISAELILQCNPDIITVQVTGEGSLYYTVLKNDITFYLQHYLIEEFDGTDDAIVTVYKGNDRLFEYGGSLAETIQQLSMILAPESITLPEFA
jgi:hypothetical protein